MKNMLIAGCVSALFCLAFVACKHDASKHPHSTAAAASGYICPMNCEKGKTYPEAGTCPVCHMNLESVKAEAVAGYICPMNCEKGKVYAQAGTCPVCNMKLEAVKGEAAPEAEYFMEFKSSIPNIEAGKPSVLSFTPKIQGNESAPVPLDLVHEKKMHLILVSDDLSYFDHVHPEFSAGGDYQLKLLGKDEKFTNGTGKNEIRISSGGKYWAFADYKPVGGLNTVDKIEISVGGPAAKPMAFTAEKRKTTVDGFSLALEAGHTGSALTTGSHTHIAVAITKGGEPVDPSTFENYLGEKAHVVMIEAESKAFLHTHPTVEDGKLQIETTFSTPGTYRGWLQFQTDGKVHTADFVLKVAQGTGHEHHGHSHH
jgi:hypothetical protein